MTVQIPIRVHMMLQELSAQLGVPVQDIIEDAVDAYQSLHIIERHNRAYAAIKADPEKWRVELEERHGWDRSASDRLQPSSTDGFPA